MNENASIGSTARIAGMAPMAAAFVVLAVLGAAPRDAAGAGEELAIATDGKALAVVVLVPEAGEYEKKAALELVRCIRLMCGSAPEIVPTPPRDATPALLVGQAALAAKPDLKERIAAKLKNNPCLRADGIAVVRQGRRVYLAGNHDQAHYYAAIELLNRWGCRWYMPTEFGECIPQKRDLSVGQLDYVYASPFEVRTYWISWRGDNTGRADFQLRNRMTGRIMPPTGHALGKYTKGLGKGTFHFPITDPKTASHVAAKVEPLFAKGKSFSLGMEDGSYDSDYPRDRELMKLQYDKYFMRQSVTDLMLELYNNVAKILQAKYPTSRAKIGFLAYANMTIPPVRTMTAERSLYCELAPIDFDPIHGMDDPQSPPRREYKEFLYRWAKVMQGRLAVYDYDQSMLVWRDVPNPSHMAFRQDVQHYRKAGILGVNTESRNAIATVFLNLFFRGQLLWNPDADVDALLEEFYPKFFGPAAHPMREYWSAIYHAWATTLATEHEYFVFPAVYTPAVMRVLDAKILEAEKAVRHLKTPKRTLTRNEKLYLDRMRFMRYSYDITRGYYNMVRAAARECDYAAAVTHGERALAVREKLTDMSGIFTTYRKYKVEQRGYAWWPGEVKQYRELASRVDGSRGRLLAKCPRELPFRRDDDGRGLARGFATQDIDLARWHAAKATLTPDSRKDWPDAWELVRTDVYPQAQGIRHPNRQSYTGTLWYRLDTEFTAADAKGPITLTFPGLFSECWLYVEGKEIAHRKVKPIWWYNDYRFEWAVDLTGKVKPGPNRIALRVHNPHHYGGLFRRAFFYRPAPK